MRLSDLVKREPPASVYAICTGAGAGFQGLLWAEPGSSAYLRGASFPYATEEVDRELGFRPDRYCSPETAVDLATEAFMRARGGPGAAVGIGTTASVASTRAHRGDHRVHTCVMTDEGVLLASRVLEKGVGRTRREEDGRSVDAACADAVDAALGTGPVSECFTSAGDMAVERLLEHPLFRSDGTRGPDPGGPGLYIPGAFNPLHEGHVGMAEAAEQRTGMEATFSLTMDHPHKPALSVQEVLRRVAAMRGRRVLVSAGDCLYLDKARRHPESTFVIGADALLRMLDPTWGYEVGPMLDKFEELRTRFLVVGREVGGRYVSLEDVPEASGRPGLFERLRGHWDVSSTELRAQSYCPG